MDELYKVTPNKNAVTLEGLIDGHTVQVRGKVPRRGSKSNDPPGSCMFCQSMIELGSTALMLQYGVRCQHGGQFKRGHIEEYPKELKETLESEEFKSEFNRTSRRAVRNNMNAKKSGSDKAVQTESSSLVEESKQEDETQKINTLADISISDLYDKNVEEPKE